MVVLGGSLAEVRADGYPTEREFVHNRDEMSNSKFVYLNDVNKAKATAEAQRTAVKAALAENLSYKAFMAGEWSKANYPTLTSLKHLEAESGGGLKDLTAKRRREILSDSSEKTEAEKAEGAWPSVEKLGGGRLTKSELAEVWDAQVAPAQLEQSTRKSYDASWRMVVTFGLSHNEVGSMLPMSQDTLKSLTTELLLAGTSVNSIKNLWSAIESRHRNWGYQPPLASDGLFKRWIKALGSIKGAPGKLIFPLGPHQIQALLRMTGLTTLQTRNVLAVSMGTVCCGRAGEVAAIQTCSLAWGLDGAYHPDYANGAGLYVQKRKNDTQRRGICTRIPGGLLLEKIKKWIKDQGLEVSPLCTRQGSPGAKCQYCPPLFPKTVRKNGDKLAAAAATKRQEQGLCNLRLPMTRQHMTSAVKSCVELLGADSRHFSAISMRRGGLSAAINAGVAEPVLFLQSGHGQAIAARRYMVPSDPSLLYATGRAVLGSI